MDFEVELSGGAPWGFRIQGGKEFHSPIKITYLKPGGKASRCQQLKVGDLVTHINQVDTAPLTHTQAEQQIKRAGTQLTLHVHRKEQAVRAAEPPVTPRKLEKSEEEEVLENTQTRRRSSSVAKIETVTMTDKEKDPDWYKSMFKNVHQAVPLKPVPFSGEEPADLRAPVKKKASIYETEVEKINQYHAERSRRPSRHSLTGKPQTSVHVIQLGKSHECGSPIRQYDQYVVDNVFSASPSSDTARDPLFGLEGGLEGAAATARSVCCPGGEVSSPVRGCPGGEVSSPVRGCAGEVSSPVRGCKGGELSSPVSSCTHPPASAPQPPPFKPTSPASKPIIMKRPPKPAPKPPAKPINISAPKEQGEMGLVQLKAQDVAPDHIPDKSCSDDNSAKVNEVKNNEGNNDSRSASESNEPITAQDTGHVAEPTTSQPITAQDTGHVTTTSHNKETSEELSCTESDVQVEKESESVVVCNHGNTRGVEEECDHGNTRGVEEECTHGNTRGVDEEWEVYSEGEVDKFILLSKHNISDSEAEEEEEDKVEEEEEDKVEILSDEKIQNHQEEANTDNINHEEAPPSAEHQSVLNHDTDNVETPEVVCNHGNIPEVDGHAQQAEVDGHAQQSVILLTAHDAYKLADNDDIITRQNRLVAMTPEFV